MHILHDRFIGKRNYPCAMKIDFSLVLQWTPFNLIWLGCSSFIRSTINVFGKQEE